MVLSLSYRVAIRRISLSVVTKRSITFRREWVSTYRRTPGESCWKNRPATGLNRGPTAPRGNLVGRSRQGIPVRITQRMPSNTIRGSLRGRPLPAGGGNISLIKSRCSFVSIKHNIRVSSVIRTLYSKH